MNKKLCNACILPEDYVGLRMDDNGVCNYCKEENTKKYLGKESLIEKVRDILAGFPDRKYDCVVGFSGGRDSTFLLWYVVTQLKLKPLAVFIDSGLIPEQTIENINTTVKLLNADLKIVKHDYLRKSFSHHFNAWLKRPVPETLLTLCVGCRLGIYKYVDQEAIRQKIPIVFSGGSPFEGKQYKKNVVKLNPDQKSKSSFVLGYLKQVILNPSLVLNPYCLSVQLREFLTIFYFQKILNRKAKIRKISLYHSYIRWEKDLIENTLQEELNWKKYPGLNTAYRGDCFIGIIRQYLYWKTLGYNDKDDHLSCLIRDHQISRDEAIAVIDDEHSVPIPVLEDICEKAKIDFSQMKRFINKN
jgi:hypothetical protein